MIRHIQNRTSYRESHFPGNFIACFGAEEWAP